MRSSSAKTDESEQLPIMEGFDKTHFLSVAEWQKSMGCAIQEGQIRAYPLGRLLYWKIRVTYKDNVEWSEETVSLKVQL